MKRIDILKCFGAGVLGVLGAQSFLTAFIYYGKGELLVYPVVWGIIITIIIISFALTGKMP